MRRVFHTTTLLIAALLLVSVLPQAAAQTDERCFEETNQCMSGRIREFWEQNGGLPVFGYPIGPQQAATIEGQTLQVQWFERNRLELHPENERPYDVLLGRLGVDALEQQQRDWQSFPRSGNQPGCRYFSQTEQSVCGEILNAWRAEGLEFDGAAGKSVEENLALFGLPISPLQEETIEGQTLQVQWFERARFELHPENNPPFHVLLGLLGRDLVDSGAGNGQQPTPPPASATWPTIQLVSPVRGLVRPTYVTHAGDGSGRLFVTEQEGTIRIIKDGAVLPAPFLDISDRVSSGGERGLLSIAFPPGFPAKNYFYIDYTDVNGDSVIARYAVSDNPDIADRNSEEIILFIEQPYPNHNGGQLAFGPDDGYLYIGKGDGGSGGDPENRAQNTGVLLGKILRIDVESGTAPYAIPPSNPFAQRSGTRGEIWAYGLRNPWRFSFDRRTGDLYVADVGQERMEEINVQPAESTGGENYGWRIMEGNECYNADTCATEGLTMPIVSYEHTPPRCSVTGGYVYRGSQYATMQGIYFYADYCSGQVWGLRRDSVGNWNNQQLYETGFSVSTFGEDEAGNLYIADYFSGVVYMIAE